MSDMSERHIGYICHNHGGLVVKQENGELLWGMESYRSTDWDVIPQYLFDALNRYQDDLDADADKPPPHPEP